MRKIFLFFSPLLFLACGGGSSGSGEITDFTAPYNYSTDYDTSQEATKQHPMLVIRLDYENQHFVNDEISLATKIFGSQTQQLNHYMNEVSGGQFLYSPVAEGGGANDGVVTVYFSSNHPDPDPNLAIESASYKSAVHSDFNNAITAVSNYGFDFSLYDNDHDGALTPGELLVIFIMAGEEDAYSGGQYGNGSWAHTFCTDAQYTPNVNGVDVMGCGTGGKYSLFGERHNDSATTSHDATIGIIAHELGHAALDLPDLYDVTYASAGIGYFGLMSSGTWGQAESREKPGQTPVPFSAWSKIYAGWYQPVEENGSDITLNGTGYSGYNIVKVPISSSEYFLLENRTTTGYDRGLSYTLDHIYVGGLAIWHIDESVIDNNFYTVNANTSHKGVDLEEASNPVLDLSSYEAGDAKNLYYLGNKTEFSPTTTPNSGSYYSSSTGITISNISGVGSSMTVDITNPN
jgi:M6 family metalloprotease-like protein